MNIIHTMNSIDIIIHSMNIDIMNTFYTIYIMLDSFFLLKKLVKKY